MTTKKNELRSRIRELLGENAYLLDEYDHIVDIESDEDVNAHYIHLRRHEDMDIDHSVPVEDEDHLVVIDMDGSGTPIGIEILGDLH